MKFLLNADVDFFPSHDLSNNHPWLCIIASDDGKDFRFSLPQHIYKFILSFDSPTDIESLKLRDDFKEVSEDDWNKYSALLHDTLVPKGILLSENNGYLKPTLVKGKPSYMQMQLRVFNKNTVNSISNPLQFFFNSKFISIMLFMAIIIQLIFYFYYLKLDSSVFVLTSSEQIMTIGLVGFGLLCHEFGHAVAAYKSGCRKVEIGVGWYVIFFVFYAELSESWRLKRKERLLIDCGGIYFQLIFTALLIAIVFKNDSPIILNAILMLNISFLWNLNPFFRMDGYWIVSDLLSVENLRNKCSKEFEMFFYSVINYCFRFDDNLRHSFNYKVLIYYCLANAFFFFMVYSISNSFFSYYATEVVNMISTFSFSQLLALPLMDAIVLVFGDLFKVFFVVFVFVFSFSVIKSLVLFIYKLWSLIFKNKIQTIS
jgi:putative peptide zinc metalloprotease protein